MTFHATVPAVTCLPIAAWTPLFNLEGSAIFGPGSEWFWALAQFIVVVVTLLAVYRQLQAQAAANAVARTDSLLNQFESKEMVLAQLQVAIQLRAGESKPHLNLSEPRCSETSAALSITNWADPSSTDTSRPSA